MQAKAVDGQAFLLGIELEAVAKVVQGFHHVHLFDVQPQGVVLQFVEVHQLVHEPEHPLNAALGHAQQILVLLVQMVAFHELSHGACNHSQWGAELMGNIRKETHVHLVRAQLLLFLHLRLTGCPAGMHHAAGIAVEIPREGRGEGEIDEPCPPGESWSWLYHDLQRLFFRVGLVAGTVGRPHTEGIVARGQV